jgi:mRNA-degrading endonuclease YafQ of YafQ-DinJ toxin-antitoxin module
MNVFLSLEAESTFSDAGYPAAQHHQPIEELKQILEEKAPWQASAFEHRLTGVRKGAWERSLSLIYERAFYIDYLISQNDKDGEPPYWGLNFMLYPERHGWEQFFQTHADILRLNNTGVYKAVEISAIALVVLVVPFQDYDLSDERKGEIMQDVDAIIEQMEKEEAFLTSHILQLGDLKRTVAPLPY